MKRLDEKLALLRLSEGLGLEPDPKLLEDIHYLQEQQQRDLKRQTELEVRTRAARESLFESKPLVITRLTNTESNPEVIASVPVLEGEETQAQRLIDEHKPSNVDLVAKNLTETVVSQGEPGLVPKPADPLNKKVELLEKWISRIAATGPGGGEVNLRWLDDVNRNSISDGQYLRYDTPLKKFTFDAGFHNAFSGSWASHYNQTSTATSATAILLDVADWQYGMSNGTNTSIMRITYPGVYNLQFSLQLVNNGTQAESAWIWLRQNGSDVAHTNTKVTVGARVNANEASATVAAWNLFFQTSSTGEYVELYWWATNNSTLYLRYDSSIAATAGRPY